MAIGERSADAVNPFLIASSGGICLKLAAGCPRADTQAARKMHYCVPIANTIEESKTEFCHWERRSPLRQMKKAELVTPPRRAGSKGLLKLELWRDEGR
ncbi:hypothetical protein AVEN_140043-1 [Araneus ventricosus]|uniref:Uncharacterized protein n=1 Tax=Araneus ventricosus TaxID=182803 RepID=A0A4Y2LJC7_ARAVE|nr:hypothetical protein AVEN_140043-1 [Araneus ventricosus]